MLVDGGTIRRLLRLLVSQRWGHQSCGGSRQFWFIRFSKRDYPIIYNLSPQILEKHGPTIEKEKEDLQNKHNLMLKSISIQQEYEVKLVRYFIYPLFDAYFRMIFSPCRFGIL